MNKRLQQFLSAENISQAQFADTIEVARASVSHVLAGRNKPGYDFIKNIADHYPTLNLDWLINGKGKMYKESAMNSEIRKSREDIIEDSLFRDEPDEEEPQNAKASTVTSTPSASAPPPSSGATSTPSSSPAAVHDPVSDNKPRSITKIVVFYDDNTYQELV